MSGILLYEKVFSNYLHALEHFWVLSNLYANLT